METPENVYSEYLEDQIKRTTECIEGMKTDVEQSEKYLESLNKIKNNELLNDESKNRLHNKIVYLKYKHFFKRIFKNDKVAVKIEKILFNIQLKKKVDEYFKYHECVDDGKGENYGLFLIYETVHLKYLLDHNVDYDIRSIQFKLP